MADQQGRGKKKKKKKKERNEKENRRDREKVTQRHGILQVIDGQNFQAPDFSLSLHWSALDKTNKR